MTRRAPDTCRRRRGADGGAVAVEFALVLPILLALVFGIINFGFVFAQQLSLGNAARQGARMGVVDDRTCAQIISEARSASATVGISDPSTQVQVSVDRVKSDGSVALNNCSGGTAPCATSVSGDTLEVEATHTFTPVAPIPFAGSKTLTGTGIFRCEFS